MLKPDEIAQLTPEGQAVYDRSSMREREMFAEAWRRQQKVEADNPSPYAPRSTMRVAGAIGTGSFLVLAIVSVFMTLDSGAVFWPILFASLFSVSVFMWMLGAIEQRLIMINETLKSKVD